MWSVTVKAAECVTSLCAGNAPPPRLPLARLPALPLLLTGSVLRHCPLLPPPLPPLPWGVVRLDPWRVPPRLEAGGWWSEHARGQWRPGEVPWSRLLVPAVAIFYLSSLFSHKQTPPFCPSGAEADWTRGCARFPPLSSGFTLRISRKIKDCVAREGKWRGGKKKIRWEKK